jgi:hypothetical protein
MKLNLKRGGASRVPAFLYAMTDFSHAVCVLKTRPLARREMVVVDGFGHDQSPTTW